MYTNPEEIEQNRNEEKTGRQKLEDNGMKKQKQVEDCKIRLRGNINNCRYAITFGEVSILHIGGKQFGQMAKNGFTVNQLKQIQHKLYQNYKLQSQLIMLSDKLPEILRSENQAAVLHIPQGTDHIMQEEGSSFKLFQEQQSIQYDKKFYDYRRKKMLNKNARFNVVFGQEERQSSQDYKQYTVKAFKNYKYLQLFRHRLGQVFGEKAKNLKAEGNHYYNNASGIGFHGDSERKIVICLSLGRTSTLRYYWRAPKSSQNVHGPTDLTVSHGDVYIMSEKATGCDWKLRSRWRLVHAAGSHKYIGK